MTIDTSTLSDAAAMRQWLSQFTSDAFVAASAAASGREIEWCQRVLATFTNEALVFAPTLAADLRPGDRVLEVGSGIGFLSLWLHQNGVDISALDPASGPFDPFTALSQLVMENAGARPQILRIGAEELDPALHGRYDLIFSFNVLEHVAKLDEAFAAMAAVLAPGGRMLHCCPNYAVPYEPHLSIPLVPGRPELTTRLFGNAIGSHREIWDSLNFITAGTVRRMARRNGLGVRFARGMMYDRVQRLWQDREFSSRHFASPGGRIVWGLLRIGRRLGLVGLLRYLPAEFATPMLFIAEKPGAAF